MHESTLAAEWEPPSVHKDGPRTDLGTSPVSPSSISQHPALGTGSLADSIG